MFRRTQDTELRVLRFAYGAITRSGSASQLIQLRNTFVTQMFCPTTPKSKLIGLGFSRLARRYYRNLYLISLPLATEMFHFARFAPRRVTSITASWVAPFGYLRIKAS